MKKLIWLLKLAYGIEIGAYMAYEGHRNSIPSEMRMVRAKILAIQIDELIHRRDLKDMLTMLDQKPNRVINLVFFLIGKTIGGLCHVFGFRAAMWGAKIMEIMGAGIYEKMSEEAYWNELCSMGYVLERMGKKEKEHERFFQEVLNVQKNRSVR